MKIKHFTNLALVLALVSAFPESALAKKKCDALCKLAREAKKETNKTIDAAGSAVSDAQAAAERAARDAQAAAEQAARDAQAAAERAARDAQAAAEQAARDAQAAAEAAARATEQAALQAVAAANALLEQAYREALNVAFQKLREAHLDELANVNKIGDADFWMQTVAMGLSKAVMSDGGTQVMDALSEVQNSMGIPSAAHPFGDGRFQARSATRLKDL